MASVTHVRSTRNIDPPDLIALAAVAALATAKAVQHLRQTVLAPVPVASTRSARSRETASPTGPVFDEDLMDRFLAGPTDVHDPDAGPLRRLQARRRAGAEAQWRSLSQ